MLLPVLGLCLAWLLPLHFPPWISWHMEAVAFFSVLLTGWLGLRWLFAHPFAVAAVPRMAWPFLLLVVIAGLQWAGGLEVYGGDVVALALYASLCVACLGLGYSSQTAADSGALRVAPLQALATCLLIGSVLSIAVALGQCFDVWNAPSLVHRTQYLRRPGGNMGQPNHLALLLVMAMASTVYLYELRKLGGVCSLMLFGFLSLGLAATESRSGALAALLLTAWWVVKRPGFQSRASVRAGVGAASGLMVLMWVWPRFYAFVHVLGPGASLRVAEAGGTRIEVWTQLALAAAQRPWLGWGLLQTSAAHNAVADLRGPSEAFSYSHNLLLDLVVWMGVPLALLFTLTALIWGWSRLRTTRELNPWYCLAVVIPLAVQAMLEFPFAYAYFLAPALFAVGALEACLQRQPAVRLKPWIAGVALGAFTGVAGWSAVEYLKVEEDFRVVRFEVLRVGKAPEGYAPPNVILFSQLGALLDAGRVQMRPGMPERELELLRRAATRFPWSATQYRYAVGLALNGNPKEAIRQMQVLRYLHGEKQYQGLKARIRELGETELPGLRDLQLP